MEVWKEKVTVGEQFLSDLGMDTENFVSAEIIIEPGAIPIALVTRYVLLDRVRRETVKEKYELVKREVKNDN